MIKNNFSEDFLYNYLLKDKENKIKKTKTAIKLGVYRKFITHLYKKYGWQLNKRTTVNKNYFSKIDSKDKAYFLGLMYADGCIYKNSLIIELAEEDKEIIYKFKEYLGYTGNCVFVDLSMKKIKNKFGIRVYNKTLYNDLINLGCFPKKSLILKFPTEEQVPKEFHSHFIRGYFDGDGCIIYNKTSNGFGLSFKGTKEFLFELCTILNSINGSKVTPFKCKNTINNTYNLGYSGFNSVIKLLNFLYKESNDSIRMRRKYDNSFNILKLIEDNRIRKFNFKKEELIIN